MKVICTICREYTRLPMMEHYAEAHPQQHDRIIEGAQRGGSAKVPKGFSSLSPEQRKLNSARAHQARWGRRKSM